MGFTYDTNTALGVVRLVISDTDSEHPLFQDNEIQAYLDLNQENVRRAAASALDTLASSQAFTLKVISTLDLHTDGASVARALREHAKELRDEANISDAADGSLFDYAEEVPNIFTLRERVLKQAQRRLY